MKRKFYIAVVVTVSVLIAGPAFATFTKSGEEHRSDCIKDMKLTDEQIATNLYNYQIDRCVEFRVHREANAEYLERLALRQKRMNETISRRLREGQKYIAPEVKERLRPNREETNLRAPAFSRRQIYKEIEQKTYKESRQERSLLRQERAKQAREACQNVGKSFYQNCVRNTLRSLGENGIKSDMPTTRKY